MNDGKARAANESGSAVSPHLRFFRAAVFIAVALACFWRLDSAPLMETDEGFTANRAASLLRHHSFLLSYDDLNDDTPQFHKPPLAYWLVAAMYKVVGYNLWAARLPTAICSFLMCMLLYLITRRHLGEWCALWSALLPCTVPMMLWYMRSSMLDMQLVFYTLLAVYLFAYARPTVVLALLAGLAAGAAMMTKGPAGAIAIVVAAVMRLVRGPINRQLPAQLFVMLGAAVLPGLAFYAAVPDQYKSVLIYGLFEDAGQQQIAHAPILKRLALTVPSFVQELRWHLPAAFLGLVCMVPQLRKRRVVEWVVLAAVIAVPVVVGASKLTAVYARYLFPAFVFILTLSAYFGGRVTASRWTALWLAPFAVGCLFIDVGTLRWLPAVAALIVLAGAQVAALRTRPQFTVVAGNLLMAAVTISTCLINISQPWLAKDWVKYHPEVGELARTAFTLVPPGERMVVGSGFTCHNAIFYSRHAVESFKHCLLAGGPPGDVRYGIFLKDEYDGIPYLAPEVIARAGAFSLVRFTVAPNAGVDGLVLSTSQKKDTLHATLDLLGVGTLEFSKGFAVTNVPSRGEIVAAARAMSSVPGGEPVRMKKGDAVTYELAHASTVCGIDVHVSDRRYSAAGLRVEAFDESSSSWRLVRETGSVAPSLGWTIENGKVVETDDAAVRFRFDPVRTRRVRVIRTVDDHFDLEHATLFVTDTPR